MPAACFLSIFDCHINSCSLITLHKGTFMCPFAHMLNSLLFFDRIGLDKSELIGDVGSRSFYLRKSGSGRSSGGGSPYASEIVPARESSPPPIPPPAFLLPTFIARKISKIVRRTRRLWKLIICMQ